MKKTFLTLGIMLVFVQVQAQKKTPAKAPVQPTAKELAATRAANIKKAAATQFQYFVIKVDSGSYGYSIYANNYLYIQQTTIPALDGKKGFPDTASASRTAQFVIKKIKEGEMPPSLTIKDLKQLKLIE